MSLWEEGVNIPSFKSLENNSSCDALIIGGGLSAIHLFYYLKNESNVCLVEGNTIGCGVSKNTTAKLTYLQDNTLGYLIQKKKYQKAKLYLESQREGLDFIREIIKKEKISCDLEQVASFLVTNQQRYFSLLKKISRFLKEEEIHVKKEIPQETNFLAGISVHDTYVFHPLKYLKGILNTLPKDKIYEHTRIVKIKKESFGYCCYTERGYEIHAKKVIVACHYPFFLLPYFMPIKTSIEKSYLCATRVSKNLKYSYITMENPSKSSRFYQDKDNIYQIFLGESHSTSMKQNDLLNFEKIKKEYSISSDALFYEWSNVDIVSFDHLPFIGLIKKDMYLMSGFSTWGMINSAIGAKHIFNLLKKKNSKYTSIFSPKRSFLQRILWSPFYLFLNAFSFLRSKYYSKKWYTNDLFFSRKNGKLIACFTDEKGIKHNVHPVCPHMKCNLIFNRVERTWDCPCHSSRFDLDGNVLKGPSKYSIKVDE